MGRAAYAVARTKADGKAAVRTDFSFCDLRHWDFAQRGDVLYTAVNLRGSDLSYQHFVTGRFRMVSLIGANLRGSRFVSTLFDHVDFSFADLRETRWYGVTLRNCI